MPSPVGFLKQHPQVLYYQIFTFMYTDIWETQARNVLRGAIKTWLVASGDVFQVCADSVLVGTTRSLQATCPHRYFPPTPRIGHENQEITMRTYKFIRGGGELTMRFIVFFRMDGGR